MQTKTSIGRKIGGFLLKTMAFLLTTVVALAVTLFLVLSLLCSDAYPSVQRTFVTTILETGQLKFLASWFLSPEEIQEIVNQNSMQAFNNEVNTDLIHSGSFGHGSVEDEETPDIEIVEVAGTTYTGTMMIVKDPSRISLATIYPWRDLWSNCFQWRNPT